MPKTPWGLALRKMLEDRLRYIVLTPEQQRRLDAEDVRKQAGMLTRFELEGER